MVIGFPLLERPMRRSVIRSTLSVLALLSALSPSAMAQFVCETYIEITQAPPDPYNQTTAAVTVEWGEILAGSCIESESYNTWTFQFTVNGQDFKSYFTVGATSATATNLPLENGVQNTLVASIEGWDTEFNPRIDTDSYGLFVNAFTPTIPLVDILSVNPGDVVERDLCLAIAAGSDAAYECGDLRVVHPLPAVRTLGKLRVPTLLYNSQHAHPYPSVTANVGLQGGSSTPDSLAAKLVINANIVASGKWTGSEWSPGQTRRITLAFEGFNYTTGRYPYALEVTFWFQTTPKTDTRSGILLVVNRKASPFGAGWWLAGLEQVLSLDASTKMVVGGDGSARLFYQSQANVFVSPTVDRPDTLKWEDPYYLRYLPHGVRIKYDANGRHIRTINRLGHETIFEYDGSARLWKITVPPSTAPLSYMFSYTATENLVAAPGSRGVTVTLTSGRVTMIEDPDNRNVQFGYDASFANRMTSRTDRRTTVTSYQYGWGSRLKEASTAMGSGQASIVTKFTALESKGFVGSGSPASVDTTIAYTLLDGPRTDVGDSTRFWLDRYGAPRRIVDALGNSAVLKRANTTWPALVTEIVHPNGGRQGATYNTQALMDTVIDYDVYYNGAYTTQKTVLEYHPVWGFVTRIAPPEGDVVEFGYDPANGNRLWQQDARGIVSRAEFLYYSGPDSVSGLLRSIKTPTQSLAGPRDSVVYDARGNLRATKTPLDRWTYFYKDLFGRDTLTVSPGNMRRRILYDLMDRDTLAWLTGDSNFVETTNVNATGIAYFYLPWPAESVFVRKTYDEEGNLTVTQRRGSGQTPLWYWLTTVWSYDRAHRMVREQHPDMAADSLVYDPAGNSTKWITRRGHHITMEYDASNRLSKRIVPEVPYSQEPFADVTFPAFTIEADTQTYSYDFAGRVTQANNRYAQVSRGYYTNGWLGTETQKVREYNGTSFSAHVYTLSYGYDRNGRRIRLTHPTQLKPPNAGPTEYRYNPWGQVDTIIGPTGATFRLSYDLESRLDSTYYPNSIRQVHRYDAEGRLERQWSVSLLPPSQSGWNNSVIRDDTLFYNEKGRVNTVRGSGGEHHGYVFTGLGHLGFAQEGVGQFVYLREWWKPDPLGNVVKHWQAVDATGFSQVDSSIYESTTLRLLQNADLFGGQWRWLASNVHDAAGNEHLMTRYRHGAWCQQGDDVTCWDYDDFYYQEAFARYYGADQMLRYVDKRANTSAASTMAGGREWFRYDALGRRVARRFLGDGVCVAYDGGWCVQWDYPEELVRYVWDGDQILYEIRARGGDSDPMENDFMAERKFGRVVYVHGPALDRPLVVERADDWWMQMFLHPDWRGRITAGSWPAGWNDATVGCTETGCDPTVPFVDWAAMRTSSYGDRLSKFREMDGIHRAWLGSFLAWQRDGTEQVYLRNRYYDPVSGRFTQEDPIGLAGGLNLYGFANGDPVNFSDPFGLCPVCIPLIDLRAGLPQIGGRPDEGRVESPLLDPVAVIAGGIAGGLRAALARAFGTSVAAGAGGSALRASSIRFGQKSMSSVFRHGEFAGQSVESVAAGLRSGAISANHLPVNIVVRDGVAYTLNNRSLMALRLAGQQPTVINNVTGVPLFERLLTERLAELGGRVSGTFIPAVRP